MSKRTVFLFILVLVLVTLVVAACGGGAAPAPAGNADNGKALFNGTAGCAPCHSVEKGQIKVGPSLAGIATDAQGAYNESGYKGKAKSAAEWLKEAIVDPNVDVVEGFQTNTMPQDYSTKLNDQQLNDIVAYLLTLK